MVASRYGRVAADAIPRFGTRAAALVAAAAGGHAQVVDEILSRYSTCLAEFKISVPAHANLLTPNDRAEPDYMAELRTPVQQSEEKAKSAKTATYSQSSTTITITLNSHGFSAGLILSLDFTSGNGIDGIYTVQTEI